MVIAKPREQGMVSCAILTINVVIRKIHCSDISGYSILTQVGPSHGAVKCVLRMEYGWLLPSTLGSP